MGKKGRRAALGAASIQDAGVATHRESIPLEYPTALPSLLIFQWSSDRIPAPSGRPLWRYHEIGRTAPRGLVTRRAERGMSSVVRRGRTADGQHGLQSGTMRQRSDPGGENDAVSSSCRVSLGPLAGIGSAKSDGAGLQA